MIKPTKRRLAAIVSADVVGYSRLMGRDEDGTLAAFRAHRAELLDPLIAKHGGRIVKTMGDGLLLEFPSVVDATRCAIEVQEGLAARNAEVADDKRITFRIGVHVGDIIIEDEDILGDGVNIAARIEALAVPGGVAISGRAHDDVRDRLDTSFEDAGEQTLKNIARPVRIWRWRPTKTTATLAPAAGPASGPPLPDKPSIAVLPFANMSRDPEQEYFSDGITDDLITALSNVQSFFVIARSSSFGYKNQSVDITTVATQLGVRYVMEGSVRKAGERVRVTAQLAEAQSGRQIWAERFDRTLDDIFDLQDEITASVVGAIEPRILEVEAKRIEHKHPENLDAYDLTLRGLDLMNRLSDADTAIALGLFKSAIDLDPRYGRAHVCASWCYRRHVQVSGMTLPEHDRLESIRHAELAMRVDAADPYVLWQAGLTTALVERDPDAGLELIQRSLGINANANRAWIASSLVRCTVGEPDMAMDHAERATRLSPLDISMWVAHGVLAIACLQLERYEEAARWAESSTRRHANNAPAFHILASSCAQLDRMDDARAAIRHALDLNPGLTRARLAEIFPVSFGTSRSIRLRKRINSWWR
jgi:TolB-like protein/class 3 adenylate cyclase